MTRGLIASGLWRWRQSAAEAHYRITLDTSFRTRSASIRLHDVQGERSLEITAENGRWYVNGREEISVRGALDVDLGWSPSTNTLPIRRLKLEPGQSSGPLVAAWIGFPGLTLEPLPQEYRRIADRCYRYSSQSGAFTAELTVDHHGLVVDYEGLWQRVTGGD